jgi:hypothetical protein
MQELKVLTNPTPPEGFRWQVVGPDGKTIKSGTAKTRGDAQTAGNKAANALKAKS